MKVIPSWNMNRNRNMNPTLRRRLIRLGSENPSLRPAIRQIVTAASQPKMVRKVPRGQAPKDLELGLTRLEANFYLGSKSSGWLRWELGEFSDGSFGYQAKEAPISVTVKAGEKGFEVHISGKTFRENDLQAVGKRLAGSKVLSDAARKIAVKYGKGYHYALKVDKGPHADTRKAAIKERHGYEYALGVDKGPHADTRKAAIREEKGYFYARFIDKGPRDDTRKAAIKEGKGYAYAVEIDKGPRPDTRKAATKEGKQEEYEAAFGPA